VPQSYVQTTQDRAVPAAAQRKMYHDRRVRDIVQAAGIALRLHHQGRSGHSRDPAIRRGRMSEPRLIIGISGATGIDFGVRALQLARRRHRDSSGGLQGR
jgi:hypothetical protein